MRYIEKQVILQTLDHLWREHLVTLDHLRQVIGWRGMAQRDPLNEYKSEAFELFQQLIEQWHDAVITQMSRIEVRFQAPEPPPPPMQFQHADPSALENEYPLGGLIESAAEVQLAPTSNVALAERDPQQPRRAGARSAATNSVPAARARSSSIVTGRSLDGRAWRRAPRPAARRRSPG